jgi:two-component system response regulator AtoC
VADSGTLFFDEVGSISPGFQAKLLRLFEDRAEFKGVQPDPEFFDFRIIVSSSVPLEKYVTKGEFRKDLYYRLNAIQIDLPPLRDRMDDIPLLADFFADKYCLQIKSGHFELSSEIKQLFTRYYWPGNVRELESLVKNVVLLGTENTVIKQFKREMELVSDQVRVNNFDDINSLVTPDDIKRLTKDINRLSLKEIGQEIMEQAEKSILEKVLENTRWNRKKAARMLDISYKSLLNKIKAYELS